MQMYLIIVIIIIILLLLAFNPRDLYCRGKNNNKRAVAAQTARSRCKVFSIQYVYYFRAYQSPKANDSTIHMASESLLSCISPFLRHLRNQ